MSRRICRTALAAVVIGWLSIGVASATPIVVGQWTWTDDEFLGSIFDVTNSSGTPLVYPSLDLLVPDQGWQSGSFTNIVVTLTPVGSCPVAQDCWVSIDDIDAGLQGVNLDIVDTTAVSSATLSLQFRGQTLTSTISTLGDGGSLIYEFTPAQQVPEPASLALTALGGAAWLVRRRRPGA